MAEPKDPAISAWLSLRIPKAHAAVAQVTMANRAAHRATSASCVFPEIDHVVYRFRDRGVDSSHKEGRRKLKTAAMRIAAFGEIARVEIQVAIAFGASVQPFTRMTPSVRITVMKCRVVP